MSASRVDGLRRLNAHFFPFFFPLFEHLWRRRQLFIVFGAVFCALLISAIPVRAQSDGGMRAADFYHDTANAVAIFRDVQGRVGKNVAVSDCTIEIGHRFVTTHDPAVKQIAGAFWESCVRPEHGFLNEETGHIGRRTKIEQFCGVRGCSKLSGILTPLIVPIHLLHFRESEAPNCGVGEWSDLHDLHIFGWRIAGIDYDWSKNEADVPSRIGRFTHIAKFRNNDKSALNSGKGFPCQFVLLSRKIDVQKQTEKSSNRCRRCDLTGVSNAAMIGDDAYYDRDAEKPDVCDVLDFGGLLLLGYFVLCSGWDRWRSSRYREAILFLIGGISLCAIGSAGLTFGWSIRATILALWS